MDYDKEWLSDVQEYIETSQNYADNEKVCEMAENLWNMRRTVEERIIQKDISAEERAVAMDSLIHIGQTFRKMDGSFYNIKIGEYGKKLDVNENFEGLTIKVGEHNNLYTYSFRNEIKIIKATYENRPTAYKVEIGEDYQSIDENLYILMTSLIDKETMHSGNFKIFTNSIENFISLFGCEYSKEYLNYVSKTVKSLKRMNVRNLKKERDIVPTDELGNKIEFVNGKITKNLAIGKNLIKLNPINYELLSDLFSEELPEDISISKIINVLLESKEKLSENEIYRKDTIGTLNSIRNIYYGNDILFNSDLVWNKNCDEKDDNGRWSSHNDLLVTPEIMLSIKTCFGKDEAKYAEYYMIFMNGYHKEVDKNITVRIAQEAINKGPENIETPDVIKSLSRYVSEMKDRHDNGIGYWHEERTTFAKTMGAKNWIKQNYSEMKANQEEGSIIGSSYTPSQGNLKSLENYSIGMN